MVKTGRLRDIGPEISLLDVTLSKRFIGICPARSSKRAKVNKDLEGSEYNGVSILTSSPRRNKKDGSHGAHHGQNSHHDYKLLLLMGMFTTWLKRCKASSSFSSRLALCM